MACGFKFMAYVGTLLLALLTNPAFAAPLNTQPDEQVRRGA